MYTDVTDSYKQVISKHSRHFVAKIKFDTTGKIFADKQIYTIKYDGGSSNTDYLTIGSVLSACLTVEMVATTYKMANRYFHLFIGLALSDGTIEWIPQGRYKVIDVQTKAGKTTIQCQDKLILSDLRYVSRISYPAKISDILAEIGNKINVTFNTYNNKDYTITTKPKGYTIRQMLGMIAMMWGCFVVCNRDGSVDFRWYSDSDYNISLDRTETPEIAEDSYTLGYITCFYDDSDENYYQKGDSEAEQGIIIENKYMTDSILSTVYAKLEGFSYNAAKIKCLLGDPRVDVWDIVSIANGDGVAVVPVMSYTWDFDGGFCAEIVSSIETSSEEEYRQGTAAAEKEAEKAKTEEVREAGALSDYAYISDVAVKHNGITYTATKDTATGLISKISDSNGSEFSPTLNSGITDTTFHNAVIMAIAIMSGLGVSTIMPITTGLVGYFDYKKQCEVTQWGNRLGGDNIPITGNATLSSDCLEMPNKTYGMFKMPYQGNGDLVVYAVVKTSINQSTQWYEQDTVIGSSYQLAASYWRSICVNGYVDAGERYRTWWVDKFDNGITGGINGVYTKSHEQYHILTLTQNNGLLCFYIDGVLTDDTITLTERYGDYWGINCLANNTGGIQYFQKTKYSGMTAYLKMLAFGRTPHTAEQIETNVAWLREYYGLTNCIMPVTTGLIGYFDFKNQCTTTSWVNVLGGNNITISGNASVTSDGLLMLDDTTSGDFACESEQKIVYCVYRTKAESCGTVWFKWEPVVTQKIQSNTEKLAFNLSQNPDNMIALGCNNYDVVSNTTSLNDWHIATILRVDDENAALYIDGAYIGSCAATRGSFNGGYYLHQHMNYKTVIPVEYKCVAFGSAVHTPEQIATNAAWLKKYYGI